tara:strand:- start:903 stop:2168 length:1266 start_codon:yes stop_codon:yes gene_type:complete
MQSKKNRNYLFIFNLLLIIFLFSSNIAWLNPFPDWEVYRSFESIPFLWQYDIDNPIELISAAYFPDFFYENSTRLERPGYPILVKLLTSLIYLFLENFINIEYIYIAAGAYIIIKIIFSLIAIICLNSLLQDHFNNDYSKLGLILYFFQWSYITYMCDIHTTDTHLNTPVIIIYLISKVLIYKNFFLNILFGFLIGYTMLIKSNYAVYFSIILLLLINKYYLIVLVNFFSHIIPFVLYFLFLTYKNIPIYFHNEGHGGGDMVVFLFDLVKDFEFKIIINQIFFSIFSYIIVILKYYHFFLILFLFGIFSYYKKKYNKNFLIASLFILFFSWLQFYLALKFENDVYMAGDVAIIIYFFILYFLKEVDILNFKYLQKYNLYIFILLINIYLIIQLPYIEPYSQKYKNWQEDFNSKEIKYKTVN